MEPTFPSRPLLPDIEVHHQFAWQFGVAPTHAGHTTRRAPLHAATFGLGLRKVDKSQRCFQSSARRRSPAPQAPADRFADSCRLLAFTKHRFLLVGSLAFLAKSSKLAQRPSGMSALLGTLRQKERDVCLSAHRLLTGPRVHHTLNQTATGDRASLCLMSTAVDTPQRTKTPDRPDCNASGGENVCKLGTTTHVGHRESSTDSC